MLRLEGLGIEMEGFSLAADLGVPEGARVAVIGPSGAGKSTLLAAIAGFQPLTRGRVSWQGQDLGPLPPGRRPLSILFQDNNLFPHLTATENIGLALRPGLRLSAKERESVQAALARVGLEGYGERRPAALSGGQQSRVALARALLRARPLLLLDEPFAALGPALRAEMLNLVREITAETKSTLLIVTHDPRDAKRIADLTVLVADGRVAPPVPTAKLFADPPPALADYLGK